MIVLKIKEVAEKNSLSITDIYRATGISRTTLTTLINSAEKQNGIKFQTLNALCATLNCSVADLIEYVPDNEANNLINKIDFIERVLYEEKIDLLKTITTLKNKSNLSGKEKNILRKAINMYEKL